MTTTATNIKPLRPRKSEVQYPRPTLDELVQLCIDFELITEVISVDGKFHFLCKDEQFIVSPAESIILVRGLLIGYFAAHTRDDLSLAGWID